MTTNGHRFFWVFLGGGENILKLDYAEGFTTFSYAIKHEIVKLNCAIICHELYGM